MAGIFTILRGCSGFEEQAIARAIELLRAGKKEKNLRSSSEKKDWQARREASVSEYVQRALSVNVRGEMTGKGGKDEAATVYSPRIQVRKVSNSSRRSSV